MKHFSQKGLLLLLIGSLLMHELLDVVNCSFVFVDDGDADPRSDCVEGYNSGTLCTAGSCI